MAARRAHNPKVAGSSPASATPTHRAFLRGATHPPERAAMPDCQQWDRQSQCPLSADNSQEGKRTLERCKGCRLESGGYVWEALSWPQWVPADVEDLED